MVRLLLAGVWLSVLMGAQQKEQEPPEEDESLRPKEYVLNPLQANKEITAGNFYFKKGNYKAAARSYAEASKWDPTSAEAQLKLGEANEKMRDIPAAREAYEKYLTLASEAKDAEAVKKRLAKLPQTRGKK